MEDVVEEQEMSKEQEEQGRQEEELQEVVFNGTTTFGVIYNSLGCIHTTVCVMREAALCLVSRDCVWCQDTTTEHRRLALS